ncbi:interleukin-27 receptor subunit alpha isoform X2 [Sceloporus undulatus]|uniref:interleukin-27 receptor subunit alpha isoform X2 n=1 Tax=Sceloporus undulatus TaxID=8520 RepID=UPI001C4BF777|nr:interleukin-27 receptor subunit alpha isoform X2 [Sceloporus undulatus]
MHVASSIKSFWPEKSHPGQTHSLQSQNKQNWLIVERRTLTQGDDYSVWIEVWSAAGNITSKKLNFSLDDIVKPPPPILDPVELDASGALVTWKNPLWSASVGHHPLSCALRYKASTDHDWTYLHEEDVGQEGHEFEDLKPFTSYEVEARCIPENGFWSEWSSPQTFKTLEAAPLGQVDVWREVGVSENGNQNFLLLWKALDPEVAQGNILDYEITYQDHSKNIYKMICHCCNATLPHTAVYAWVTARNSIKKTLPANLSLEQTERPGPEETQVVAVPDLGLNVTWKPSTSPQWVQPEEYVVEWREELLRSKGRPLNWIRRPGSSNSAQLRGDFRPKIPYRVSVYALYADGSSTSVAVQAYFKEEAPSASPQALQDRSISSTASHISWKEIPLESRNGHITHYTLYLNHSSSGNVSRIPIGATKSSYKLSNLTPGTSYQLWMTGSNSAGEGVASHRHHFSTPAVSHWQIIVVITLVVVVLLILAAVLIYVRHRWVLGFCHKILPPWCWERVPDPGHSMVASKINEQNAAHGMDTLCQYLDQSPKGLDIIEIEEPAPQLLPPPSPAPVVNSGYEKHFMPTLEEMQKLS